jgi:hypothetical protein
MIHGIPSIVALLGNDSSDIGAMAANLFGKLVDRREFLYISILTEF